MSDRVILTFSTNEAEGLADLLEMQHQDRGFLELAAEIRTVIANIELREAMRRAADRHLREIDLRGF